MSEKREKSRRKPASLAQEELDLSPAEENRAGERHSRKKKSKWDYSKTIRLLYIVALVLAVTACVMIGVKTYEDLSSGKNAETLLQAYKDMATVSPVPEGTVSATPTADPNASPTPDNEVLAAEADDHRVEDGSEENVDESANYVPPDEPKTAELKALIAEIASSVGDDGVIGILSIPRFEQEYPIIGKWSYNLLKISICRYKGPGVNEAGNLVLIGHNYKSGAHFGNLKNIEVGDEVFLQSGVNAAKVRYEVYEVETVAPDAFSALESYEGECGLTLMTCTNNGNNRRIVRCVQKAATATAAAATDAGTVQG